jgi:hypothetical protein
MPTTYGALRRYDEGLEFIRGLNRREGAAALKQYGQVLLRHLPVETTAQLMGLCMAGGATGAGGGDVSDDYVADLAEFTHLYADRWLGWVGGWVGGLGPYG